MNWISPIWGFLAPLMPWIASISLALGLVSLILLPILIIFMPHDYFLGAHRRRRRGLSSRWFWVLRNSFAFILMTVGILMLVLPGQGLLTILAAVALSDVPGKYRIERWLILRPGILKAINWVRQRYKKKPVAAPPIGFNRHGRVLRRTK